jgi:hypothetical protein
MAIKTLWTILLKILGLWFIIVSISTIVQLLSIFFIPMLYGKSSGNEMFLYAMVIVLLAAVVFILIVWLLVFKTAWIIEKLQLTKGFTEEKLELTMEWTTILKIATIVIGGVIFIDSFPLLFKQILSVIQRGKPFRNNPESIWIFLYLVKTVLGYLLMTNSRFVVHLLARQNDQNRNGGINDLSAEG